MPETYKIEFLNLGGQFIAGEKKAVRLPRLFVTILMLRLAFLWTIVSASLCTAVPAFQSPVAQFSRNKRTLKVKPYFHWPSAGLRILFASLGDEEESTDFDVEETLLKLHFSVNENVEKDFALQKMSKFCQSFPFAAILPVQPLQYLPTTDGGVDVRFLRKKTNEKGSLDGGIRFFVSEDRDGIDVVAKRNSRGQTGLKMFSEKLVVQSFIKRVTGEEVDTTSPAPTDVVTVSSVFHKWMD